MGQRPLDWAENPASSSLRVTIEKRDKERNDDCTERQKSESESQGILQATRLCFTRGLLLWVTVALEPTEKSKETRQATNDSHVDPTYEYMPSTDEIFGWIGNIWKLGADGKYGLRVSGTPAYHKAVDYMLEKFKEFGLERCENEVVGVPACFPGSSAELVGTFRQLWPFEVGFSEQWQGK